MPHDHAQGDLRNLDVLRTAAVLLVFFGHIGHTLGIRGVDVPARFGVLLFFVHTSLVLMLSMERARRPSKPLYLPFMVRRIFRIYPLAIVTTLIVLALRAPSTAWAVGPYVWPGLPAVIANLALVQNITHHDSVLGPQWSLPYEVQMYAVLPPLFLGFSRVRSVRLAIVGWAVALVLAFGEGLLLSGSGGIIRYFPCFFGGIIAWTASDGRVQRGIGSWLWPIWLFALVVCYRVVMTAGHATFVSANAARWFGASEVVIEASLCGIVGLSIPRFRGLSSKLWTVPGKLIAKYSYGIYLSHMPFIWLVMVKWQSGPTFVKAILVVACTAAASAIFYHVIEEPGVTLGKRIAARFERVRGRDAALRLPSP